METYQPIYDATRSRIRNGDVGAAIERAVRDLGLDMISHHALCAFQDISASQTAPHVLMRPSIGIDGNMYSALYGDNIMEGCVGYGKSIAAAMADFDKTWHRDFPTPENVTTRPKGPTDGTN